MTKRTATNGEVERKAMAGRLTVPIDLQPLFGVIQTYVDEAFVGQFADLLAQVTALQAQIDEMQTAINSYEADIENLEAQIEGKDALIATHLATIAAWESDSATKQAQIWDLQGQVADLQAQIAALDVMISDQNAYIATLQAQIVALQAQLASATVFPVVTSISDLTVNETASAAVFTVTMDRTTTRAVSINYTTANGTATAGQDYTATSGILVIPPGALSAQVSVPIINDTAVESNESFTLVLSNPVLTLAMNDASGTAIITSDDVTPPPPTGGFRDSTNTGWKNAPGAPSQLTPWNGVNQTAEYRFIDFGEARPQLPAGAKFFGCRFTSLWDTGWIIDPRNAIEIRWCTFEPTGKTIPNAAWPSAGAGRNAAGDSAQIPYMLPFGQGYQFAIRKLTGSLLLEDSDIWGFGNAITLWGTAQKTIRRCWIHDAARGMASGELYHHDGIGHLDNGGCSNVLIEDCTIASLGNTNGIAFQAGAYSNLIVRRNFISGWGFAVDMGHAGGNDTALVFDDNIIATDIQWVWGPIYTNFTTAFRTAGSSWKRNKFRVLAGTSPRPGSVLNFSQADDGKFVLPSGALSTTDFV